MIDTIKTASKSKKDKKNIFRISKKVDTASRFT